MSKRTKRNQMIYVVELWQGPTLLAAIAGFDEELVTADAKHFFAKYFDAGAALKIKAKNLDARTVIGLLAQLSAPRMPF